MAKTTIKCSECGVPVKPKNLEKHMTGAHSPEAVAERKRREQEEKKRREKLINEVVACEKCGLELMRKNLKKHMKRVHGIGGPFRLISRRGIRVEQPQKCNMCGKVRAPIWRYSQSTRGEVYICGSCKPKLFDKSFARKDALDYAQSGGGFESNRRKH